MSSEASSSRIVERDLPPPPPEKDNAGKESVQATALPPKVTITEETDLSTLSAYELQELNQGVIDKVTGSDRPLISALQPMSVLREEYENGSQNFVRQIDYLEKQGFTHVRRTKGDGDCFYRSIAYAYIARLLQAADQPIAVARSLSSLDSSLPMLKGAGFQEMVYDDFYSVFISLIRQIVVPEEKSDGIPGSCLTDDILLEAMQDPEVSNYVVVFLRLLTSAQIRTDADTYIPFLFNPETGEDIDYIDFCERHVEAVNKEADHVQITALSRALKVNVDVAYLDGHVSGDGEESGKVNFVQFHNTPDQLPGTKDSSPLTLLYRPGHYDILERKG